jgi:hypothetical protein
LIKKPSNDVVLGLLTIPSAGQLIGILAGPGRVDLLAPFRARYHESLLYLPPLILVTALIGFFYYAKTSKSRYMQTCKAIDILGIGVSGLGCFVLLLASFDAFPQPR